MRASSIAQRQSHPVFLLQLSLQKNFDKLQLSFSVKWNHPFCVSPLKPSFIADLTIAAAAAAASPWLEFIELRCHMISSANSQQK
jgi:hypothetical protein